MKKVKILIVHGWLHSARRYQRLKKELESRGNIQVTLYEFPGFGKTPARYRNHILKHYTEDMVEYLRNHHFDVVIAHSMGGNVALRAASRMKEDSRLILMNPVYRGIPLLRCLLPVWPLVFAALKFVKKPGRFRDFLLKAVSLLTINRWRLIDDLILCDARRADVSTAALLLFEMAFDRFKLGEAGPPCHTLLFVSEKDRIIPKRHIRRLAQDLKDREIVLFPGIGHTIVLEDFERLADQIISLKNL